MTVELGPPKLSLLFTGLGAASTYLVSATLMGRVPACLLHRSCLPVHMANEEP